MAHTTIQSNAALTAGLRATLNTTYKQNYDGVLKNLADVVALDLPSDKRTEIYALHRTMPYPAHWRRGDAIPVEATDTLSYQLTNLRFGKGIEWEEDDRKDNQIADLFTEAQQLGANFASLPSRMFAEVLAGSASLLPNIPNSPDGAALFSATDGASAARFGVSGGNIITGTGVASAATIVTDFFSAVVRQSQFLNTKGQPYFEPDVSTESYTVYFGVANTKFFTEAFVSLRPQGSSAAPSNIIIANGVTVRLVPTQRITDNDWYVFRADSPVKAVFTQLREGLTQRVQTPDNSDKARTTAVEGVYFKWRGAIGVNVPFAAVKVNN